MRGWIAAAVALAVALIAGQSWAVDTATPGADAAYSLKDGVTLAIAVLGAVLGILNTWNSYSARRLRVSVRPEAVRLPDTREIGILIDVINLSAFHVTVAEIGFTVGKSGKRFPIRTGQTRDGSELPTRLDPRESVGVHVYPYRTFPIGTDIRLAYARLASGEIVTGNSPALRQMRDEVAKP